MAQILALVVVLAAVVMLAQIMRVDFHTMKVPNRSVLILAGLYLVWSALNGFDSLLSDAGAGALLFLIALAMWLAGAMGAGDVKLYAVIGLFIGFAHLGLFVLLLLLVSVIFVIALRYYGKRPANGKFNSRLKEFYLSGKAPYAVPMCAAAIPAIVVRTFV